MMLVVIRQYNKPLAIFTTRSRKGLSDRDIRNAKERAPVTLEVGYFDIVLTTRPADSRYDVDSVIEIR